MQNWSCHAKRHRKGVPDSRNIVKRYNLMFTISLHDRVKIYLKFFKSVWSTVYTVDLIVIITGAYTEFLIGGAQPGARSKATGSKRKLIKWLTSAWLSFYSLLLLQPWSFYNVALTFITNNNNNNNNSLPTSLAFWILVSIQLCVKTVSIDYYWQSTTMETAYHSRDNSVYCAIFPNIVIMSCVVRNDQIMND